jgi:hypothetical protein
MLTNPEPIAIGVIDAKFGHAVECDIQSRDIKPVFLHLSVKLNDVIRVEIKNRLPGGIGIAVDGLIQHQATCARSEHGPALMIVRPLDTEAELFVEFNTGRYLPDRQHRNYSIESHLFSLIDVTSSARWRSDESLPDARTLCLTSASHSPLEKEESSEPGNDSANPEHDMSE